MPLSAQWFNDNMGTAATGVATTCPWKNLTTACNPSGVTNLGVCVTGSVGTCSGGTPSGSPYWFLNGSGPAFGWTQGPAANTRGYSVCTFTYTLTVTGSATISSGSFVIRRSSTATSTISTFTINGTSYLANLSGTNLSGSTANITVTYTLPTPLTVVGPAGTITIVLGCTGASCTSDNWGTRIDDFQLSGSTAAPIELSAFDAKPSAAGVHLKWETTIEQNNDHFAIERSSDGLRFEEIGQVKGAGNSVTKQPYDFQDQNPEKGVNYYRLKQVDFDGIFDYSPVRTVRVGSQNLVRVSPNPLKEGAISTVFYESTMEGDLNFIVFNQLGQLVLQKNTTVNKGDNTMDLDLSSLPKGIYALQCQSGTDLIETQQIIIK